LVGPPGFEPGTSCTPSKKYQSLADTISIEVAAQPSKLILLRESSLRRALTNFCQHYYAEGNQQGKGNRLLFPRPARPEFGHENGSASIVVHLTRGVEMKPVFSPRPDQDS
jgi:hypothetical protein